MTFERPKNFKIPLSKSLDIVNLDDDVLRKYSRSILEKKKFQTQVLSHQDSAGTEMAYHVAEGKNVLATFEKLKREVMDIHFASLCQNEEMRFTPVVSYECKCDNEESEIKFITRPNKCRTVNIVLKLVQQPKSVLYPNKPVGKFIRISVGKKIPPTEKIKESFDQFMNSGGLLIDFIIDTIHPVLLKKKPQEREAYIKKTSRNEHKQKCKKQDPDFPRAFSGSDRAPRNFEFKKTGFISHGGPQEKKTEMHHSHTRGDPIPRFNSHTNTTRGPKSNYTRGSSENAQNHYDARKTEGSFGSGKRVNLNEDDMRDPRLKRSKSRRGGGGGGRVLSGSEGADWRK